MKPSFTIPEKSQNIGSLSEPNFHGHFRPQSNQYMINTQNTQFLYHIQPWSSHGLLHFSFKNFINSVPSFGTDQTANSRPFSYQDTIYSINHQTWHPNSPSRHGYKFWVSINSINSVLSFGTNQTAVQGLKLTETSKNI